MIIKSTLNPNASNYTPKTTMWTPPALCVTLFISLETIGSSYIRTPRKIMSFSL
jgi:hypothetical protein